MNVTANRFLERERVRTENVDFRERERERENFCMYRETIITEKKRPRKRKLADG